MPNNRDSFLLRYGCAAVNIALAIAGRLLLDPVLGTGFPFATLFFAILLTAWLGGFRPALVAVVLGGIAANYFLLPPRGSFSLAAADQWAGLFLYGCTGLGIAMLGGSMAAARQRAEASAKDLEARVLERTAELVDSRASSQGSEARMGGIVSSAMDAIISVDSAQRVVLFNAAAEKMFHCAAPEAMGQTLDRFLPQRFREQHRRHVADFGKTGVTSRSMRSLSALSGLRADGEEFPIEASISQIEVAGEKIYTVILRDITDRKRADEAAALLAAIVESSFDAIIGKNLDSIVTSWNSGAERMFGYTAGEMIGRSIILLIPPDREGDEERILARIKRGETVEHFETVRARKDGGLIDVSVTVSPIRNAKGEVVGASKVARDVSERKRAEQDLRESEERFRAYVEQASDSMFVHDISGRFTAVNRQACASLGYSREELLGMSVFDVENDFDLPKAQAIWRRIQPDTAFTLTGHQRRKDGSTFPVEIRFGCFDIAEQRSYLGLARDISERVNAAEALRAKDAQLHAMDRRLAEIVHGMTEACFALDTEWRFTFVNDRGETLLRHRREEMLGRTIWEVFHQLVGTPMEAHYRRAMTERRPVAFEAFSPIAERWLDIRLFPSGDGLAAFLLDIHARKLSEEALRESEIFNKEVLDSLTAHIAVLDREGHVAMVNEAWRRFAVQNQRGFITDCIGEDYLAVCERAAERDHDDIAATVLAGIRQVMDGSQSYFGLEYPCHSPDQQRWFQLHVCPLTTRSSAVVTAHEDITERKQAEEKVRALNADLERRVEERTAALHASEARYRMLFDSIDEGFCIIEVIFDEQERPVDYRFLEINPAFERQTGLRDAAGKRMRELAPRHEAHWFETYGRIAVTGESARFQNHAKELHRWYDVYACRFGEAMNRQVAIVFGDITERTTAEANIGQLNAELQQRSQKLQAANQHLEAANKELEAFSYSVSHDLRAPLRAIDGFSRAVVEDYGPQLPAEGQRYLQTIRNGAQRMGHLIDDLLAFSRLSRLPLNKSTVNTARLVQDALHDLGSQRDGRQIEMRIGELPPCSGDAALLKQVWINLLSNAFKYTRKREAAVIEIGCTVEPSGHVYFVRDNGTGFDMRYADKLFGVFQRLHRAEEFEGTGVGLAIVQRVIHRHGGNIWAEAELDRGATFYFTLEEETKL